MVNEKDFIKRTRDSLVWIVPVLKWKFKDEKDIEQHTPDVNVPYSTELEKVIKLKDDIEEYLKQGSEKNGRDAKHTF